MKRVSPDYLPLTTIVVLLAKYDREPDKKRVMSGLYKFERKGVCPDGILSADRTEQ